MMGCDFIFHANGAVDIEPDGTGKCTRAAGDPITFTFSGCTLEIEKQTGLKEIKFHTIKPITTDEITFEGAMKGITYTATGPGCPTPGTFSNGEFTTLNTILTGADPVTHVMTNISWTATVA